MFKNIDDGIISFWLITTIYRKKRLYQGWFVLLTSNFTWCWFISRSEKRYKCNLQERRQNQLCRCNACYLYWLRNCSTLIGIKVDSSEGNWQEKVWYLKYQIKLIKSKKFGKHQCTYWSFTLKSSWDSFKDSRT
jgi:hypothetical protein